MTSALAPPAAKLIVQRQFYTFAEPPNPMPLDSGASLGPITLAYETLGTLNSERTGLVPHRWALSMPRAVRMKACSSAPWQTCSVPRSACRARSPLATHRPLSGKSG